MRKYMWMLFIVLLLTGCGAWNGVDGDETMSAVYVTEKEIIPSDGSWGKAQYIGDTLYYVADNRKGYSQNLYEKCGEKETMQRLTLGYVSTNTVAVDTIGNIYYFDYSKNNSFAARHWILCKRNVEDQVLFEKISAEPDLNSGWGVDAAASADGYCVMFSTGNLLIWDSQLQLTGKVDVPWYEEDMYTYYGDIGLVNGANGIYLIHKDNRTLYLERVNIVEGILEEAKMVTLPEAKAIAENGNCANRLYSAYEDGIYIMDYESLYLYNDSTQELTEVFRWSEPGVAVTKDYVMAIGKDASGRMQFAGYDFSKEEASVVTVQETTEKNDERETITIGYVGQSFGVAVGEYVEEFNRTQNEVLAVRKAYEDIETLQQDIAVGKGPDVLDLTGLDIQEYVEKGLLEGLGGYLKKSDKLNAEDILPSLLAQMTLDGEVRLLAAGFRIKVMILDNEAAQDVDLTPEEFLALGMGQEGYLCEYDAESLFEILFSGEMDSYVNWKEKSCSFDDGRFAELLKMVKNVKLPDAETKEALKLNLTTAMRMNNYKAAFRSVNTLFDYDSMQDAMGDIAVIVGMPDRQGEASYKISFSNGVLGINSASKKKEAAWKYVEFHIAEYAHDTNQYNGCFSVMKDKFEEQLHPKKPDRTTYIATNIYTGNREEVTWNFRDEDKEAVQNLMETAVWNGRTLGLDGIVGGIVKEETSAFFKGSVTAKEAAENIQSRVTAYMNE